MLVGCSSSQGTAFEAAQSIMGALTEGDRKGIEAVNRSTFYNFPTDHLITLANDDGLVGLETEQVVLKPLNDRFVKATWKDREGNERTWYMEFNQEIDGFYFIDLDGYEGERIEQEMESK